MPDRPRVLLSVAVSIDGHIDDRRPGGLALSNAEDLDRVDQVRADSDAILIGAGTLRADDPRITVKSERRLAERVAAGRPAQPTRVLVTASGDIDPTLRWFHTPGRRIVYTTDRAEAGLRRAIGDLAEIVPIGGGVGTGVDLGRLLADLAARGVEVLMVEGGERVGTALLTDGLVDEIHLVVAPLLVGSGPRFLGEAAYPWPSDTRMEVLETRAIGDVVLIRYRIDGANRR